MGRSLARLPIRLRLTLAFGLAMALVLAAMSLFLYLRMESALDRAVDRNLRDRADDVAALVRRGDVALPQDGGALSERGQTFAQVLDQDGAVVNSSAELAGPLISPAEVSRAQAGTISLERQVPGDDEAARLLGIPVDLDGRRLVVVVGESLEPRGEALESLVAQLLVGGPLVLLLTLAGAYVLAARALHPVERMRREAEFVSEEEPGRRLPIPPARDEIAALGETLNEMLGRLEVALARERRFVSDASHELRTPLAALRTELELALRRERTPAELTQALGSAAEETERLSQLAEDLLVLARSDAGSLPVRRERLSASELLADVRERYVRRATEAGRDVVVAADRDLELSADRLRLEQALGNLVENALRHGEGRIDLSAARRNGHVELGVEDQGPGFAADFIGRAFEPFSRGHSGRSAPGAGLGLAIVEVIARAHGGSAHAANGNPGARAWIVLP